MSESGRWSDEELTAFEAGLTPENLSAIMRSTWTWDDRALRRDLARLLTVLRAVRELDDGGGDSPAGARPHTPGRRRASWPRCSARG